MWYRNTCNIHSISTLNTYSHLEIKLNIHVLAKAT